MWKVCFRLSADKKCGSVIEYLNIYYLGDEKITVSPKLVSLEKAVICVSWGFVVSIESLFLSVLRHDSTVTDFCFTS